jgi:hydroxymethylpyrimidine/phosphomethylpyrimidine kinase
MLQLNSRRIPRAMTVAGSDSGGGAGIQADLKTFAALRVYGTSVLTAVTAQNTLGVNVVHELPAPLVAAQIDSIMDDMAADSVKTGMLLSTEIIETVVEKLQQHRLTSRLVVDPVMVATGGDRLLRQDAVEAIRRELVPLAFVLTPNIPETEELIGRKVRYLAEARRAAYEIVHELGASSVVVKGGHLDGPAVDIFYDGHDFRELSAARVETTSTHGTGCTFASAVAAYLARGRSPIAAAVGAKRYVTKALQRAFPMGKGHGPLNHLYRLW